jgi:hypothetical protein
LVLALVVAVAAIALGLALGLFPVARRRALGPLRTLALAAVIGVAVLHLLPEAFATLGLVGVVVFALGLVVPRWVARLRHDVDRRLFGLELGFLGLLIHHVGDGLALGVYSRLDEPAGAPTEGHALAEHALGGHSHADVLLALVLHTVPLVAVVSAGYAQARGAKSALARSLLLAAASAAGIFAAQLIPEALVEEVQAWIAAGVAGLLLHGMSHDITSELPRNHTERAFDLLAAAFGLAIGWIGAKLDVHHGSETLFLLDAGLVRVALTLALPLLVALVLGASLVRSPLAARRSRVFAATRPENGMTLGPEPFLLSLCFFGWEFALVLQIAMLVCGALAGPRETPGEGAQPQQGLRASFAARLDEASPWVFVGVAAAAVLGAALPEGALNALGTAGALGLGLFVCVGLPIHALFAPILAAALVGKGLWLGAALLVCIVGPLLARVPIRAGAIAAALGTVFAATLGERLVLNPSPADDRLSWGALVVLLALVLVRIYQLGFRGWLAPLRPDEPGHPAH